MPPLLAFTASLLSLLPLIAAQCPPVSKPCTCSPEMYEPVTVVCDRGQSLDQVIQSLSQAANTRIDRLAITNTPIAVLPPRAFGDLKISALSLQKNGLSRFDPAAFDGPIADTLTELNVERNQLGSIPQSGITNVKNLKKLILKNNHIGNLPPRAFSSYESAGSIEKIDLSSNQMSGIGTVSLEGLTGLKEISFETNTFRSIPSQGLRVVRQTLEDLNLGLNKISDVPLRVLDFPNLKSLSLEFNQIQYIQPEAFRGIPKLLFLYIGGNKFNRFDPELYRYVPQLEILGIGDTNIQEIPRDGFKHTPRLKILEMSDAAVNRIQKGAFQRIRSSIMKIVLNKNELTRIPREMFQGLSSLESLNLANNKLSTVDDGAWANLPSLAHLDISYNLLRTLDPHTFEGSFLPSIASRTLFSCGNPWVCDERLAWFRAWLRQEISINIDKPPSCLAECAKPDWLNRWPLRDPDPITTAVTTNAPIIQRAATMSTVGWIILAIILAILLTSILLLGLVRWFVSRRRRRDKEQEEEERILRSSAVGSQYHAGSVVGSAYPASAVGYPGSGVDLDLPPAHTLQESERAYW